MAHPGTPRTDRTRFVLAAIAALVGLVWTLQGAGVLPGSFMTGDPLWLVLGLALLSVGREVSGPAPSRAVPGRLLVGLIAVVLAAGCAAAAPSGSLAPAGSPPGTPSSTAEPTANVTGTPTSGPSAPGDPIAELTGRPLEALARGGKDVVLRIEADGFRLPEGERLYDAYGDRVLAARPGPGGTETVLVVRDLEGTIVREIPTGMAVPQTGIVRGDDVYFGGIDLTVPGDIDTAVDRGVWVASGDAPPESVFEAEPGLAVYTAIERSPDGRSIGIWRCGAACETILVGPDGGLVRIPKPGLIALSNDVALVIGAFSDVTAHAIDDGRELWRAETPGLYYGRYATSDGERIVLSAMERLGDGPNTDQLRIQLLDALTGAVEREVVVPTDEPLLSVERSLSTDRYVAIVDTILPVIEDGPHRVQVVDLEAGVLLDVELELGGAP